MTALSIDFETRSVVDLPDANAYVYFDHPTTDVWCMAYAFDGEEVELWTPDSDEPPTRVFEHIAAGGLVNAWNAAFERLCFSKMMGPRYGWPVPKLTQWRCTMAAAYAMSLPGSLDMAAPAIGLDIRKDDAGYRLMLQMSKPRRPRKDEPQKLYWWDDEAKRQRLGEYCKQDVRVERAVGSRLLPLSDAEQKVWFLDQVINDRGVYVDKELCEKSKVIVAEATRRLDAEIAEITDFAVTAASNTGAIRKWLAASGLQTDSVAKDVLETLLARDDLTQEQRRVLEIRRDGGKSSTAKIDAMLARRQADGRMRGNLQYHGAGTGRWAARGAQLQNLMRPTESASAVSQIIDMILEG